MTGEYYIFNEDITLRLLLENGYISL